MFIERLNEEQVVSFVKKIILNQNLNDYVSFYRNRDRFISHIKSNSGNEILKKQATYVLIENIIKDNKQRVWACGYSIVVLEDGTIKNAQPIRFCFEDFKISYRSSLLVEDGSIRKQYALFMREVFGNEYKEKYNEYLKNNLDNEMIK